MKTLVEPRKERRRHACCGNVATRPLKRPAFFVRQAFRQAEPMRCIGAAAKDSPGVVCHG